MLNFLNPILYPLVLLKELKVITLGHFCPSMKKREPEETLIGLIR